MATTLSRRKIDPPPGYHRDARTQQLVANALPNAAPAKLERVIKLLLKQGLISEEDLQ